MITLTDLDIQAISERVIAQLKESSVTIDELSTTNVLAADDMLELNKGRKVSLDDLRKFIRGNVNIFIEIITKDDKETIPSDSNVFSSLRTLAEIKNNTEDLKKIFIRKDQSDLTEFLVKFLAGLEAGEYTEGSTQSTKLHKDGLAELGRLQVNGDSEFRGNLSSRQFVSGFPNGIGWALRMLKYLNAAGVEQEKAVGEVDDWIVRGKLRVFEFIISQLRGENDNVIFAGMMKVDHYDAETGRIYLDTDMGIVYNPFRFGDILMMQRFGGMPSEDNGYNVIKQYELRVEKAEVGDLSEGENRLDWITFTNFVGDTADIEEGDVLVRVDSLTDPTRKGVVKVTTIDEFGAPYIDVVYGMKTDPANATKARLGNLSGIRTKNGTDLTGIWGLYANGAYFENSTYILADGNTIEQKFSIMNGEFNSAIGQIKNNMSLEDGNILSNSTFSENLDYWSTPDNSIFLYALDGILVYDGESFLSEKKRSADISQDSGRNVLRLKNASVRQYNSVMNIPVHEDADISEYTYSILLYYRAVTSGVLSVGVPGTDMYVEESISPSDEYIKLSHVGKWNEEGDFIINCTGEVYIYGVSFYNNALADTEIRLQTQITQNAEAIKLTATKEYVDSETEAIYTKYDAELALMAEQISLRVTESQFNAETESLERLLEGKITIQADRIDAAVTDIDKINNTIETAGWLTTAQGNTLYASKSLEDGETIVSYINQTPSTVTINASKINLRGAVTFTMFDNSLQSKINGIESDANDALSSATTAYTKAIQASSSAANAQSDADQAIRDAAQAIQNAANAVSAAGSAQAAVDSLPEWSREASIIQALQSATVIVNGYIKTSMIDVDNLYCTSLAAIRGTVGGFTIASNALYNDDRTSSFSIGDQAGRFFRVNKSGETGMVRVRADGSTCIYATAYGSNDSCIGLDVLCNSSGYGYAIRSRGNVLLEARTGETIQVNGLCCNVRSVSGSTNVVSNDDILIFTGTTDSTFYFSTATARGKVIFFKRRGSGTVTLKGNFINQDKNTVGYTLTIDDYIPRIFVYDGTFWYEFSGKHN